MPTKQRKATLGIYATLKGGEYFVRFDASNNEPLGTGETHPDYYAARASREAWLRAMIEVLEGEGYIVSPPDEKL